MREVWNYQLLYGLFTSRNLFIRLKLKASCLMLRLGGNFFAKLWTLSVMIYKFILKVSVVQRKLSVEFVYFCFG